MAELYAHPTRQLMLGISADMDTVDARTLEDADDEVFDRLAGGLSEAQADQCYEYLLEEAKAFEDGTED